MAKGYVKKFQRRKNPDGTKYNYDSGVRIKYIKCPICNMTKPKNTATFTNFNIDTDLVLQIREGGGYATGFKKTGEGETLEEITNNPEYSNLIGQLERKCKEILRVIESVKNP